MRSLPFTPQRKYEQHKAAFAAPKPESQFPCAPGVLQALLAKGAQLGVVLSFMMSVTTLSLPSMIMLRKAVKPKLLGVFIAICTIGIILVGYFFNAISYLLI